jgi:hypothetical protein
MIACSKSPNRGITRACSRTCCQRPPMFLAAPFHLCLPGQAFLTSRLVACLDHSAPARPGADPDETAKGEAKEGCARATRKGTRQAKHLSPPARHGPTCISIWLKHQELNVAMRIRHAMPRRTRARFKGLEASLWHSARASPFPALDRRQIKRRIRLPASQKQRDIPDHPQKSRCEDVVLAT